jgi:ABC-2 type transport system ATP-binding protein
VRLEPGTQPLSMDFSTYGEVLANDDDSVTLRVPIETASTVTARLLAEQPVSDLTVEDPPIEDAIERVFATEAA